MIPNINWIKTEEGGLKAVHDEGDFEGARVTEASIVLGGNGLWTPFVYQTSKGRKRKRGNGRINGVVVMSYFPGQVISKDEAIRLCENKWRSIV